MKYELNRIEKTKTRILWNVTIEGVRLNNKNYATKWEAEKLLKDAIKKYGKNELLSMISKYKKETTRSK